MNRLPPALHVTLADVGKMVEAARRPWWIIGSAAAVLHGVATEVADVDLVIDVDDAPVVFGAAGLPLVAGGGSDRFCSVFFGRREGAPLPVEIMAGLNLREGAGWTQVGFVTRVEIDGLFVPSRAELAAVMRRFGRDKDFRRAALLDPTS